MPELEINYLLFTVYCLLFTVHISNLLNRFSANTWFDMTFQLIRSRSCKVSPPSELLNVIATQMTG